MWACREALCTFSANFAALTDVEQMACCTDLVQRWVVTYESCRNVETKDDQSCECTESSGKDQRESIKALHGSPVDDPSLSMLSSISPRSLPEKFLHHLLYDHCHGDVQAAANLILTDEQGIDMLLTSWTMKFQDSHAQMESPIDKASRQAILHKYQLEAIPDDTTTKSKPQAPVPLDWRRSSKKGGEEDKTQKAKAVRYRDGAIVSTKGEKVRGSYIIL